jgi:hypothetical protein
VHLKLVSPGCSSANSRTRSSLSLGDKVVRKFTGRQLVGICSEYWLLLDNPLAYSLPGVLEICHRPQSVVG